MKDIYREPVFYRAMIYLQFFKCHVESPLCILCHSGKFFRAVFKRLNDILNGINFRLIKVNFSTLQVPALL